MLFNSPIFLFVFLPVVLSIYFLIPHKVRNLFLLLASLLFYVWGEKTYFYVVLYSLAVNFIFSNIIEKITRYKKTIFFIAVISNICLLFYFKYSNFFLENVNELLRVVSSNPIKAPSSVVLPLGISFFTFHNISYLVDIYKKKVAVQKNPIDYALYILLFPQLLAGPIIRYHQIHQQITNHRRVNNDDFVTGIQRFIGGLAKKSLIANYAAQLADPVFNLPPADLTFSLAWLGAITYTIQIYFDFSGYSDMAIGLARMFGFKFPENFNYPYGASSITDFWRRWHISLSSWFREYVYIPLGGNRNGKRKTFLNLLTVFFLCGLWHGANWTFIVWGLWHGSFLILERTRWGQWLKKMPTPLQVGYTLSVVMVGWVMFRAPSVHYALFILKTMTLPHISLMSIELFPLLCKLVMLAMAGVFTLGIHKNFLEKPQLQPYLYVSSILVLIISIMVIATSTYNPFIYYNF